MDLLDGEVLVRGWFLNGDTVDGKASLVKFHSRNAELERDGVCEDDIRAALADALSIFQRRVVSSELFVVSPLESYSNFNCDENNNIEGNIENTGWKSDGNSVANANENSASNDNHGNENSADGNYSFNENSADGNIAFHEILESGTLVFYPKYQEDCQRKRIQREKIPIIEVRILIPGDTTIVTFLRRYEKQIIDARGKTKSFPLPELHPNLNQYDACQWACQTKIVENRDCQFGYSQIYI